MLKRYVLYLFPLLAAAQPSGGNLKLFEAIHSGDVAAVRAALKSGAGVNVTDEKGATPLMHAAAYCSLDCMKVLLAAGAKVNVASNAGFTPLMWSVWDPAKINLLLSKGAALNARSKDGNTALILVRQNRIKEAEPLLLRAGAVDEQGPGPDLRPLLQMDRDLFIQTAPSGWSQCIW